MTFRLYKWDGGSGLWRLVLASRDRVTLEGIVTQTSGDFEIREVREVVVNRYQRQALSAT